MSPDRDAPDGTPDAHGHVRGYYRALDDGDYDLLRSLLHPSFVHERPDMTLDGRDRFVAFMRDERPRTDTRHPLDGVYERADGRELAARGRLLAADGSELAAFVDVFSFEDGALRRLRTFTG